MLRLLINNRRHRWKSMKNEGGRDCKQGDGEMGDGTYQSSCCSKGEGEVEVSGYRCCRPWTCCLQSLRGRKTEDLAFEIEA
ncbi:hypothetical protein VTL71DRAFT_3452 [Oculimacula yallundae]|uniref:Uncharacterized protein n=1 Tax=Oculimacula yallundae TaxID=86028 RepID=A0ABR4C773_9HELO